MKDDRLTLKIIYSIMAIAALLVGFAIGYGAGYMKGHNPPATTQPHHVST